MSKKKPDITAVDVIASGYEWECPECGEVNNPIEFRTDQDGCVTCDFCKRRFKANMPEHAYG
jgi:uncharacterized protein (DUF983 family)